MKRTICCSELHPIGGEGLILRADVLRAGEELLPEFEGKARTVYADPPFGTGGSFEFRRGKRRTAYTDQLSKEEYSRLIEGAARLAHGLLKEDGTFFLHIDYRMSALCRGVCDSVFGEDALTNEIVWAYKSGGRSKNAFSKKHDTILMYRKSPEAYFDLNSVGVRRGAQRRNHMKRSVDETGRVFYSIKTGGREYRYYEDDLVYPSDVWDDIEHLHQRDPERTGFLTQKPEALLKRMILATSEEGDLVCDLFGGSGTAAAAAAKAGRRFISVDMGAVASAVTRRRLIERCLKMRLYESAKPLAVRVSPTLADEESFAPDKYFDMEERGGGLMLSLKKLPLEEEPYFVSVGRVEEGCFSASDYLLRMRAGEKISLPAGACLCLVDEELRTGYWSNEDL